MKRAPLPKQWDVVGLGQAMVDFSSMVDDDLLQKLGLDKGSRKLINDAERSEVLKGREYKLAAGGSMGNTLVALSRLGMGSIQVALAANTGNDSAGELFRSKLGGVHLLTRPLDDATTGSVIVLTTPDAQRTMLAYQGASCMRLGFDDALSKAVSATRILVVEGYLWEVPGSLETIRKASKAAHQAGALVALSTSDVSCLARHREELWTFVSEHADILFTNTAEANVLCGFTNKASPSSTAGYLSKFCHLVALTDGAHGSYIAQKNEEATTYIPAAPCNAVDTCGAGDAYAAGILYGLLLRAPSPQSLGNLASKVAATVVAQQGPRLKRKDACQLSTEFLDLQRPMN